MRRGPVSALGVLASIVLAGCSGGTHSGASSSVPDSIATLPSQETKTPPKSYRPLLAAVTEYFALIADGHTQQAYARAVSDRCRQEETFVQFQRATGTGHLAQGVQIWAYRTHGTDHGAVQFLYPDTALTATAWPWIKERGAWREDGCRPSG